MSQRLEERAAIRSLRPARRSALGGSGASGVEFDVRNVPNKSACDSPWKQRRMTMSAPASGDSEGIRFSPHIYNSTAQIDAAVAAVRELAG